MLSQNDIDPRHLAPIQAALLRNRSVVDEHLVARLYKTAKKALADPKTQVDPKMVVVRTALDAETVAVSCTDADTGLFIQLTGTAASSVLTFGKKYCQEITDAMRRNASTRIW